MKAQTGPSSAKSAEERSAPYSVRLSDRAEGGWASLEASDPDTYALMRDRLKKLAFSPRKGLGITALTAREGFRVRQGDWRALYLVDDTQRTVLVTDVLRRNESTY